MAWYRTGTVAITNGSTAVVGTGTAFVANVVAGLGIFLPDGRIYEVASVTSNTALTLATPYLGSSGSGQAYQIVPTRGPELGLAQAIAAMVQDYGAAFQGAGQGRFGDGTLIAPGMRFTADENTGFYRPGNDQIGFVTNGIRRLLLGTSVFQIDVPLTGTAVTQGATDTTSGRLVRTNDFGLGNAIQLGPTDNLDTLTASGFYYSSTAANAPGNNYPLNSAGSLLNIRRSATNWTQRFSSYTGSSLATQVRIFERSYGAVGWSPWVEIFHQGSILGTVSQSGGVPTGRVIERGSNANGEYVRFADGTQICTIIDLNLGSIIGFGSGTFTAPYRTASAVSLTWPANFIASPAAVPSLRLSGDSVVNAEARALILQVTSPPFSTGWQNLRAQRVTGDATNRDALLSVIAIGRWF